jgi:trimethylamine--corrinoid protein Co-methyltransferase
MLADYVAPPLDAGIAEALQDYVDRRKASEPDAFG